LLILPQYSSEEILRTKLLQAISYYDIDRDGDDEQDDDDDSDATDNGDFETSSLLSDTAGSSG
jgi:hypothetical protein